MEQVWAGAEESADRTMGTHVMSLRGNFERHART
jgi:hypothetical protein